MKQAFIVSEDGFLKLLCLHSTFPPVYKELSVISLIYFCRLSSKGTNYLKGKIKKDTRSKLTKQVGCASKGAKE